jgi:triphosphatase
LPNAVADGKNRQRSQQNAVMSELELKFQVPAEVVASLRAELRRRGARPIALAAAYFDTPDFALAEHHVSLRLRCEGGKWVQTLKAEGRSAVDRLEHNVPLAAASDGSRPMLEVSRHAGTEAGALLHKVLGKNQAAHLAERYATDVTRLACELHLSGSIIEAAFDEGTIIAGGRNDAICELELEHKAGDPRALFEVARTWSAYAGLWLSTRSKAMRGDLLAHNLLQGPAVKAGKLKVHDTTNGPRFLRAVLRATLDQVLANASEVAASNRGSVDEEHIHQLRVGLRRLRTALRELGALDDRLEPGWAEPLAQAFSRLGEVRDSVTAQRAVRSLLEQTDAPKLTWTTTTAVDPIATVRDAALQTALLHLLEFALQEDGDQPADAHAQEQLLQYLQARLWRLHRRVAAAGERFERLPIEKQHRARKRLKRLRYLAEFAAALSKHGAAKRYLDHLEPAQDALGEHVDIAVAMHRFSEDAHDDSRALFAARYLEAYLGNTARIAHAALQEVSQAEPFWN